jgi:ribosomal protein L7/L12
MNNSLSKKISIILNFLKNYKLSELNILKEEIVKHFNIDILKIKKISSDNKVDDVFSIITQDEKTVFDISLLEIPQDKKIAILKIVRNITGYGLKESKDIIDNLPKILKQNLSKEECDKIKNEIENFGGKVLIN